MILRARRIMVCVLALKPGMADSLTLPLLLSDKTCIYPSPFPPEDERRRSGGNLLFVRVSQQNSRFLHAG